MNPIVKNPKKIETIIRNAAKENNINLEEDDVQALCKAYLKFGDIDLALNKDGDVLSDIMEGEALDVLANALEEEFAPTVPAQLNMITINGKPYATQTDEQGELRFAGNEIIKNHLALNLTTQKYDELYQLYSDGTYTTEEWTEFNYILGSKVEDFMLRLKTNNYTEN